MKSAKQVHKIAVLLRLSYASGRDLLYGISQYARTKCQWRLHVINLLGDSSADELRETVARGEVDGIIANGADAPAVASVLDASETPLVIIGAPIQNIDSERAAAFVHNDDVAIGRCGAAYLSSLGRFRSYGFASLDTGSFNRMPSLRERGFREGLSGIAGNVRTYRTAKGMARRSVADTAALGAWLKAMPKPAAVMAVHDMRALQVIEAAAACGLRIPDDIALIGVDNDELLCETAEPTLTSIAPDHVRLGELAAATLKSVMARPLAHHAEKLSATKTIIERQSARHIVPAAQLVERISAYIHHNATKGIGAADVVRQLGVSRRLAETRFKQITGGTILDAILATRLAVLKRRLHETDTPIAKLSAGCGFKCENYAKRLFKNRFGVSMSEWRKAFAAT